MVSQSCVWWLGVEVLGMLKFYFFAVSQDCMLSLFVMLVSFWMVFWEYKTELFWFLPLTEGTDFFIDSIPDGVWGAEDELEGALSDEVEISDWLYL